MSDNDSSPDPSLSCPERGEDSTAQHAPRGTKAAQEHGRGGPVLAARWNRGRLVARRRRDRRCSVCREDRSFVMRVWLLLGKAVPSRAVRVESQGHRDSPRSSEQGPSRRINANKSPSVPIRGKRSTEEQKRGLGKSDPY